MTTIHKYPLRITHRQAILMPAGAILLHVGLDAQKHPCIWAKVTPSLENMNQVIYITGTGQRLEVTAPHYIGTFVDDECVWHVHS